MALRMSWRQEISQNDTRGSRTRLTSRFYARIAANRVYESGNRAAGFPSPPPSLWFLPERPGWTGGVNPVGQSAIWRSM